MTLSVDGVPQNLGRNEEPVGIYTKKKSHRSRSIPLFLVTYHKFFNSQWRVASLIRVKSRLYVACLPLLWSSPTFVPSVLLSVLPPGNSPIWAILALQRDVVLVSRI